MQKVVVSGSFDDLRSPQVRFLEEAAKTGSLTVLLWSDELVQTFEGRVPKFPTEERRYVLESLRFVNHVWPTATLPGPDALPAEMLADGPLTWAVDPSGARPARLTFCQQNGLGYRVISAEELQGFPIRPQDDTQAAGGHKKIIVTGCFDWLHSGHMRFFEEAAQLGDLYVVVGNDQNVRLLKGEGHPLFSQDERRYMVQSARYVKEALISTGMGWMDAEPEIERLKPDIYLVNEDGDKPEKRAFCAAHRLEYVVLQRRPRPGLEKRSSTDLRGF